MDLIVKYKGKKAMRLNERLIKAQKCEANLEEIKKCFIRRLEYYDMLKETNDLTMLRALAKSIEINEFKMQELYGFPQDAKFHRFWEAPKCTCPKMDNRDSWPSGFYSVDPRCPLHGN